MAMAWMRSGGHHQVGSFQPIFVYSHICVQLYIYDVYIYMYITHIYIYVMYIYMYITHMYIYIYKCMLHIYI